jgi:hypothetical protein
VASFAAVALTRVIFADSGKGGAPGNTTARLPAAAPRFATCVAAGARVELARRDPRATLATDAMNAVLRSDGLTPSERYLKRLCDRSFLTLWSYPNLYLDKAGGQELCDLLVVFGNHVIIFSDKSCAFPDSGDLTLDWSRWYRRSITKSAEQVYGAERWIRSYPQRIFLDRKCTQRFPLKLAADADLRVHRIVVALGAAARCRAALGGSGSLMLFPLGEGLVSEERMPFAVGDLDRRRGYVHVLDDVTLDVLLGELDTLADFTAYLSAKEHLVRSGRLLGAAGEEELLAYYLQHVDANDRHEFRVPKGMTVIGLDEGLWTNLRAHPQYQAKMAADEISYTWDNLIEAFTKNVLAGTLARGNELGVAVHEEALRIMAAEPRLARRMLGASIMDLFSRTGPAGEGTRIMSSRQRPDVGYIVMLDPRDTDQDTEAYRERRTVKLEAYCRVAKHVQPGFVHVVGIATEPIGSNGSSEDLIYLDTSTWSAKDAEVARDLHEKGGLLKTTRRFEGSTHEFPRPSSPPQHDADAFRRARNKRKKRRQEGAGRKG